MLGAGSDVDLSNTAREADVSATGSWTMMTWVIGRFKDSRLLEVKLDISFKIALK